MSSHIARHDSPNTSIDPAAALDRIHAVLSGTTWDAETIEHVAEIVEETGRRIAPPEASA